MTSILDTLAYSKDKKVSPDFIKLFNTVLSSGIPPKTQAVPQGVPAPPTASKWGSMKNAISKLKSSIPTAKNTLKQLQSFQLPTLITDRLANLKEINIVGDIVYVGDDQTKLDDFKNKYCEEGVDDASLDIIRKGFKLVFSSTDEKGRIMFNDNPLRPCNPIHRDIIKGGLERRMVTLQKEIDGMGGVDTMLLRNKIIQMEKLNRLIPIMDAEQCQDYVSGEIGQVDNEEVNDELTALIRTFIFLLLQNMSGLTDYSEKDSVAEDIVKKLKKNTVDAAGMDEYLNKWRGVAVTQGKDVPNLLAGILENMGEFKGIIQKMKDSDSDKLLQQLLQQLDGTMLVSPDEISMLVGQLRFSTDEGLLENTQKVLDVHMNSQGDQVVKKLGDTLSVKANMSNPLVCKNILNTILYLSQKKLSIDEVSEVINRDVDPDDIKDDIVAKFLPLIPQIVELTQNESPEVVVRAVRVLTLFSKEHGNEFTPKKYSIQTIANEDILKYIGMAFSKANSDKNEPVAKAIIEFLIMYAQNNPINILKINGLLVQGLVQASRTFRASLYGDSVALLNRLGYDQDGSPSDMEGGSLPKRERRVMLGGGIEQQLREILMTPGKSSQTKLNEFFDKMQKVHDEQIQSSQNLATELTRKNEDNNAKNAVIAEKTAELSAEKTKAKSASEQISALQAKVNTLEEAAKTAAAANSVEIKSIQDKMAILTGKNGENEMLLKTAKGDNNTLKTSIDTCENDKIIQQVKLNKLQGIIDKIGPILLELEGRAAGLKDENVALSKLTSEQVVQLSACKASLSQSGGADIQYGGDVPATTPAATTPAATTPAAATPAAATPAAATPAAATPAAATPTTSTLAPTPPAAAANDTSYIQSLLDALKLLQQRSSNTRLTEEMFTTLKARIQELEDKLKECFDTKKQLELNAIKRGGGKRKRTITKGMRAIKRKVNNIKKECEKVKQKDDAYKGKMNFMDFALKFKNMLKSK
jgi:hypothetical protein